LRSALPPGYPACAMPALTHVSIATLPPERFLDVLDEEQYRWLELLIKRAEEFLGGRVIWSVNSTATGGGVAEMLKSLLAYARGAQIDARWLVIAGDEDFFRVTKRIHNNLHGESGDGGPLGPEERASYEATLATNGRELAALVRPQDLVLLHDPQTAGLIPVAKATGAKVVWRAHIGLDIPNQLARDAWSFLLPYVEQADAFVFSRKAFAWEGLDDDNVWVIPPSIDALSPKNQALDEMQVRAILHAARISDSSPELPASYTRTDGTPGRVDRHAEMIESAPLPYDAQIVAQVSRWDRLKDPIGVMDGFVRHLAARPNTHLVLAGPAVEAVADDPEGAQTLAETRARWEALHADTRERVHLACLPMDDPEENAAMVNALQRRATVVVQKSLAEGFGLTVAEAMWKGRPVVASRIGGIQDQIEHERTGLLVDPTDLDEFGASVGRLLDDPALAARMGAAAQRQVQADFLGPRHLGQYVDLFARLLFGEAQPPALPAFPGSTLNSANDVSIPAASTSASDIEPRSQLRQNTTPPS